jgi:cytochrome P450
MMRTHLPPGPRYPAVVQAVGFWSRPLAWLERCRRTYGTPFTIRLPLSPPFVILADPDSVKDVFRAPPDVLHPGEGAKVLEPVVGASSVILLDEGAHMEQRKLMLPAFHGEKMRALSGLVQAVAEAEVARWPRDGAIELHPRMQRLTLEVILRAVFGLDPGRRLDALRERLARMLTFGDRPISLTPPKPGTRAAAVLERVGPFASFARVQAQADELIFELIDERRGEHAERDDVLAMLLEARHDDGSPMSDEELRDELMTLLVAGHETTASALAWTFERLSRLPDVRRRLVEEIEAGEDDAYLTATIHEGLRCRPVLPNNAPRLVKQRVEVGGRTYEPGVCLVPNAYLLHHDPAVYPDPYAFRPERFLDEPPGTYTWIPFGGGRRRCLGASFALLEMKLVLRAVLAERELRPVGAGFEPARRRNITIRPGRSSTMSLPGRQTGSPRTRPVTVAA